MHKITKGLKKKKNKTKKSKHKEEELFNPEELEAYRREHQQTETNCETSTVTGNDEWKKFNALTAGIDTFLKKTQDDLDRIKSTSFFQRVPPPSEISKEQVEETVSCEPEQQIDVAAPLPEPGIVEISESDSDDNNEDDIFDTAYIDALAASELKLAYIPESPTEEQGGDDPFDTSIAERAILGPTVIRKGKKLVPLGSAVEVLTGRIQAPTCVSIKKPSTRRTVLQEKNLLYSSFDSDTTVLAQTERQDFTKPSLLDDDTFLPPAGEPIDLRKSFHIAPQIIEKENNSAENKTYNSQVQKECGDIIILKDPEEDDDDIEFALLAAESLSKPSAVTVFETSLTSEQSNESWNAFKEKNHDFPEETVDPFDTTFAENIVPGKFVLKVIEEEILNNKDNLEFNLQTRNALTKLLEDRAEESKLKPAQAQGKDLLSGSITDLSTLGDQPLHPKHQLEYCDPFDTSLIEKATVPGQTELKFLEKELLSDLKPDQTVSLSDDEFDPRVDEFKVQQYRQDRKLSTSSINKTVAFTLPLPEDNDVFTLDAEDNKRVIKPLTPYYERGNSISEQPVDEDELEDVDPFDTSFLGDVSLGKAELKVIESIILQPETTLKHSISDQDFNPRDEKQVSVARVVQAIKDGVDPLNSNKLTSLPISNVNKVDLLVVDDEISTKVLTPAASDSLTAAQLSYGDPFDTSIATNIFPGKAELKLLETELINNEYTLKRGIVDSHSIVSTNKSSHDSQKELPELDVNVTFDIESDVELDPFDTSIVNNIVTGQIQVNL